MSMGLSGVSNYHSNTPKYMQVLASGKRINSAADDASGLAIAKKLTATARTSNVKADNYNSEILRANVADGAMSGINDIYQDMTQDSIRALNGTNSDSDKATLYDHMNVLSQGISAQTRVTYNEMNVISDEDAASFQVEGNDLSSIESSSKSLLSSMAVNGAVTNGSEHAVNVEEISALNTEAALSRKEDAEMGQAIVNQQTAGTLDSVHNAMEKRMMDDAANKYSQLFASL